MSETDVLIGRRIRIRRCSNGLSQVRFGELIGVTYQQVHKYETGRNRVSAAMLHKISNTLRTPIGYFYRDLDEADEPEDGVSDGELQELATKYRQLPQDRRDRIRITIRMLARSE